MPTNDASINVLVTRPQHQSAVLCGQLLDNGFQPIPFPVIDIQPVANPQAALGKLQDVNVVDYLIFVSANAAIQANKLLQKNWPDITGQIIAIGPKTADTLTKIGLQPHIVAPTPFNSEQLLEQLPKQLIGQTSLIIKGEGGRAFLAEQLLKCGMQVISVDVYTRKKPSDSALNSRLALHYITITSQLALDNLFELLPNQSTSIKSTSTFVVFSTRIADYAKKLGCQRILVSSDASDSGLVACIVDANQT
ncbi:MAG: uroporphyrinogen-III synthase [Cycloclasticus sp.]|nr:MAG: uroporphyrinogen-III synthase [Cycloclasticus sp.]